MKINVEINVDIFEESNSNACCKHKCAFKVNVVIVKLIIV